MLLRLVPLLLLAAVLASGCSSDDGPVEKIYVESSSSPLGPGSEAYESTTKDDGKPRNGKGQSQGRPEKPKRQRVVAARAGVTLKAPKGWTVLADGKVRFAADSPRARQVAEEIGLPLADLQAMVEQVDVFLTGFAGVVTVGPGAGDFLPSQATYEAQFGDADVTVERATSISTPLGKGRLFRYRATVGGITQAGSTLYVLHRGTLVEISSSAPDGDQAQDVLDSVVRTLRPT